MHASRARSSQCCGLVFAQCVVCSEGPKFISNSRVTLLKLSLSLSQSLEFPFSKMIFSAF